MSKPKSLSFACAIISDNGKDTTTSNAYFSDDNKDKIEYLESIASKQLDLYNWFEAKVSTLATINSILLGASTLFIDKNKIIHDAIWATIINVGMILIFLLPLSISLAIALWHIRPKMSSGKANSSRNNHRSSNGIIKFKSKDEYKEYLAKLTAKEICEDISNQIYGMNHNIWESQSSIKKAVLFDLIGLVGFIVIITYIIFCGKGASLI